MPSLSKTLYDCGRKMDRRRKPKQQTVKVSPTSVSQSEGGTGVIAGVVPGVTLQLLIIAVSEAEPSPPVIPTYAVLPSTALAKLTEPDKIWFPSKETLSVPPDWVI